MGSGQHVSQNRVSGSLLDTPVPRLLDACHDHLVTGWLQVTSGPHVGRIELRGGGVDEARFGDLTGAAALERMRKLGDGDYEVVQRLPDLSGALGSAAAFEGDLTSVSLVELMRHCEDNALTCTIAVERGEDTGAIEYRVGEIVRVACNGEVDDDRIVELLDWDDALFRVTAPPLNVAIEGWPSVRRDATAPFHFDHLRNGPVPTEPVTSPVVEARTTEMRAPTAPPTATYSQPRRFQRMATGTGGFARVDTADFDLDLEAPPKAHVRLDTESVITSARPTVPAPRPLRATWWRRLRLGLARLVAGQPIEPAVPMVPANRKFERAAFALKRRFGGR